MNFGSVFLKKHVYDHMTVSRSVYISPTLRRKQFKRVRTKMTKLQIINTFLTARLMAALNEIMDMIGGTVLQYETELDTIQKDNEHLRRKLKEMERHMESNGPDFELGPNSEPASLRWGSTIETEAELTEIYENQVPNDQITSTKVEEISSHVPLVTEPDINSSCSPIKSTLTTTDTKFETNTFQCDVKTEPMENFDSQFTNTYTSAHSPLTLCTATADAIHKSNPNVFQITHSRTDQESSNHLNICSKVMPTSLQVSIKKKIRTTCPETGIAHINYITSHRNTDLGSAKSRTHDAVSSSNVHVNAAVTPPRHVTPFSRESRQGRGRGRVKNVGKHACSQCGKQFAHHSRLKVHMRIHTGEKPYACAQCGKRFNNDGTLRNHRRVHLQLRLYDCPVCSRSFKDAYTCRNHMRVHDKSVLLQQTN